MNDTRLPIDLLVAKGKKHLTKKEIADRKNSEIKADADNIFAPAFLTTKKQKEQIEYLKEELLKANIVTNLDATTLGRYIILEEQWEKITKKLLKLDVLSEEYGKLLIQQTKVFGQLDKASTELGLNILARCKIAIPKAEEKPVNKFSKFKGVANG